MREFHADDRPAGSRFYGFGPVTDVAGNPVETSRRSCAAVAVVADRQAMPPQDGTGTILIVARPRPSGRGTRGGSTARDVRACSVAADGSSGPPRLRPSTSAETDTYAAGASCQRGGATLHHPGWDCNLRPRIATAAGRSRSSPRWPGRPGDGRHTTVSRCNACRRVVVTITRRASCRRHGGRVSFSWKPTQAPTAPDHGPHCCRFRARTAMIY
jgi:hypothetical protein